MEVLQPHPTAECIAAAPAQITEVRQALATAAGPAAVERFDTQLAAHPRASLLRLELLRRNASS